MPGRLLVAYSNAANYVPTTQEYLASIGRYSQWDVDYVHVTHSAALAFDLNDYDAVFQSYCARWPEGLISQNYSQQLRAFRGIKLLSVQDEYERTNVLREAIRSIGYHAVFTCMPAGTVECVFPPEAFGNTEFLTVLTGYVPEHLAAAVEFARMPLRDRPIVIGYRGRDIGARYGRRGFEKYEIGRRIREICVERCIPHDIEWCEDKRLYGPKWYKFVGSCRTTLGSETGSNVFDFDGCVEREYERLSDQRGHAVSYEEFLPYTDPIESQFDTGLISPRVFEAAALRTPMILFSGRYSGLIAPEEHYIELKKNFSNIDAVLDRLADVDALASMAERAFEKLVGSGDFGYRQFVKLIDLTLERKADELGIKKRQRKSYNAAPEIGVDLDALANAREFPTPTPRHPVFFRYKCAIGDNVALTLENSRLTEFYTAEIRKLDAEHSARLEALHRDYRSEIQHLQNEVEALHRIYKTEIADLGLEIQRLHSVYQAEIGRYQTEIQTYRFYLSWLIKLRRLWKRGLEKF